MLHNARDHCTMMKKERSERRFRNVDNGYCCRIGKSREWKVSAALTLSISLSLPAWVFILGSNRVQSTAISQTKRDRLLFVQPNEISVFLSLSVFLACAEDQQGSLAENLSTGFLSGSSSLSPVSVRSRLPLAICRSLLMIVKLLRIYYDYYIRGTTAIASHNGYEDH